MAANLEPTAVEDPKEVLNFEAKALLQIHYNNFTERELWIGHNYMVTRTKVEARNREALRVLTGQEPNKRTPRFIAPFMPLALDAVDKELRTIEEEVSFVKADKAYRRHRKWVRWLLDAGRTPEETGRIRCWTAASRR